MSNKELTFKKHGPLLWDALNWEPSATQLEQIITLQQRLRHWNNQINLTRLIEEEDFWIAQVFDSIWPLKEELKTSHKPRKCIDVGTGCGVPGLLVAIALPAVELTLLDSVRRKTKAIEDISATIGLNSRTTTITERVEITGHNPHYRNKFDLALARAVATPPVVAEYLVPFLKEDGEAILFRGKWNHKEQEYLSKALVPLNAYISHVAVQELPANKGIRHQIRLKAANSCPTTYPRKTGIPQKKPLGS